MKKPIYREGLCKSWGLGQFEDLIKGLAKKRGVVFLRRVIPQCTHVAVIISFPPTSFNRYSCFNSLKASPLSLSNNF